MLAKIKRIIKNPSILFIALGGKGWFNWLPDEIYLKLIYRLAMGRFLDLDNPKTYTEKLQWLKLYDRNDVYTTMVDKHLVKEYVSSLIGEEYIIPTLGIWENVDDIDFNELPNQFVLKCTHDSGGLIVCTDKNKLDIRKAKEKLKACLMKQYFWQGREWPYKNIKPMVIAEKYMEDRETEELRDYKFFVFNGVPKVLFIASERQNEATDTKFDFFDMDFNDLHIKNGHNNSQKIIKKPACFNEMKLLASKLSQGIPQLRVDFYEVNGKVYFGELTFFHHGGLVPFEPEIWDLKFGDWIELPKKNN